MVCYPNRKGKAHDGDTIEFGPAINGFCFARVCPKARDRTRLIADVFAGSVNVTNAMKRKGW